jgi:hypothetical protein
MVQALTPDEVCRGAFGVIPGPMGLAEAKDARDWFASRLLEMASKVRG